MVREHMGHEDAYSVLMSVYQRENPAYFKSSIESMMKQTLPFSDFVLVCDGPLTKELDEVITWAQNELGDRFQCVRLAENGGLGKALKEGIVYCRCPIIARMDSDDLSRPDRCRLQMRVLKEKNCDLVSGSLMEFVNTPGDGSQMRVLPETSEEIVRFSAKRNPFNHPCVMYRKEAVLKAGNYQHFPGFEDYWLWMRMLKNGCRGWNLPEILLDMRVGNGMYARRGGVEYVKNLLHFQYCLKQENMISKKQFLWNCICRVVAALIPNGLRSSLYHTFLRKKSNI